MAGKVDELTKTLEAVQIKDELSFAGRQLRINNADDAKPIVTEIENTSRIVALRLTGNTVGVAGCEAIGKALAKHPELERLLCSDMFTGRLKEEIAPALSAMTNGVHEAGARVVEMDFSDNAFGPNGICGLTKFINGPSCANLTVLRLNNNGLGIYGAKMLAESLVDSSGQPVCRLRVFVAGRNRLENEGIKRLSSVFAKMGSLEELAVPQNGIQAPGIEALCEAVAANRNMRVFNVNDNTLAQKGSAAVAKALLSLPELITLNLGDCLLRNDGALKLADSLKQLGEKGSAKSEGGLKLRELIIEGNEIRESGAIAICESLAHCTALEKVTFDSNEIGESELENVRAALKKAGRPLSIASFEECVSADEDEDEEGDGDGDDDDEDDDENDTTANESNVSANESTVGKVPSQSSTNTTLNGNSGSTQAKKTGASFELSDRVLASFVNQLSSLDSLDKNLSIDSADLKQRLRGAEPAAISALLVQLGNLLSTHGNATDMQRVYGFVDNFVQPTLRAQADQSAWFNELTNDYLSRLGFIKNEYKLKPVDNLGGQFRLTSYVIEKRYVTAPFCQIFKFFLINTPAHSNVEGCKPLVQKLQQDIDKFVSSS